MQDLRQLVPSNLRYRWWEWRTFPTWYFDPRRIDSQKKLEALRHKHQGQRCFIIGNGPSLNKMDLQPLAGEITIGLNRIYLIFEKIGFSTTYHITINHLVLEQCIDEILAIQSTKFINWESRALIPQNAPVTFFRVVPRPHFSKDVSRDVWDGATVTYVAMQLAYHLGCNPVILVGVDHNFQDKGPANQVVISNGADLNHFDPDYFGKGFRWQLPNLKKSEIAYSMAKRAFEKDDREIIDATVGGKLQIFRKADYQELVG